ncbi:MAG: Holliday junction branch migration protein RuvA [Alphaproteobacteria bacterium]|nr:Holliday junction branch migration protein RuvA [Alphaproteobacteria bacterium]
MIARLTGLLAATALDSAVIDVNGVGYLISASSRTLTGLGPLGSTVVVHVETHVREDAIQLYGFTSEDERDWFRLLQTVQGVGGRVALAILSVLTPAELQSAIAMGDSRSVTRANGVGAKLAARIVNELADKAGALPTGGSAPSPVFAAATTAARSNAKDALSALANLGFKPAEANRAVAEAQAELGEDAAVGDLVRVALKKSAR